MLKIHKDGMVLEVSKGAFKSIYSPSGWAVVEETPVMAPEEPPEAPGVSGGSNPTPDPSEPPEGPYNSSDGETPSPSEEDTLENMSDNELKQYASLLGLKVKDLKTRESLIKAIQDHQE